MKKNLWLGISIILFTASAVWGKIGGGDVTFMVKGAAPAVFSHDSHVGRAGLKCTECHYQLYSTLERHSKTTMADMQKGKSCGACHNGKKAFDVKGNCDRCHKESL